MRRSNFLLTLFAPILLLFRKKDERAIFNDKLDDLFYTDVDNFTITMDEPIKLTTEASFQVDGKTYKCPVPQDNEYHTFAVKYDKGEVSYFVDGIRTLIE
jgi:hypothetical protein